MFITLDTTLDPSVQILFVIVFFVIIIGLSVLLFISIRKSYMANKKGADDDVEDGAQTKKELLDAMDQFIRRFRFDNEMTLITFEYDDIKTLRDTFGDRQYERSIRQLSSRVRKITPKNAVFASTGNDQYSILLRGRIPLATTEQFVQTLIQQLQQPLLLNIAGDSNVTVHVVAGIVTYPDGGHLPVELLKNSEMALYMAKKDSRKNYIVYNKKKDQTETQKMEYYREIKEAMRNKEFILVYQPIIDTKKKTVCGFESLIRWSHPTLGVLPPNKFLNIMEHTGDIIWVGKWGIEVLCNQYNEWSKQFPKIDFFLSFNISPKQLLDPQIANDFNSIVKKYRVKPEHICLEIVEFAMFEKYSIVTENINKLHNVGFKIAIDDFGLDVNSLSRISNLPIDIIKFERNFLSDIEGNYMLTKVANMLVDFANESKKQVIAEGVENIEMLSNIEGYGIYAAQGYLFSKPLATYDVDKYIREESWMMAIPRNNSVASEDTKDQQ